jgi:hypothetical protein
LYKYSQREFPYRDLVETNRQRSREEFEYELLDSGVFHVDRYSDVFVEYAKEGPENLPRPHNCSQPRAGGGPASSIANVVFRNTWSWGDDDRKPLVRQSATGVIQASHHDLGRVLAVLRWGPGVVVHRE